MKKMLAFAALFVAVSAFATVPGDQDGPSDISGTTPGVLCPDGNFPVPTYKRVNGRWVYAGELCYAHTSPVDDGGGDSGSGGGDSGSGGA